MPSTHGRPPTSHRQRRPFRACFIFVSMAVLVQTAMSIPSLTPAAETWKPAPGPLKTKWASLVTPESPLPEYPRPQMVRRQWQNLNGLWEYAVAARSAPRPSEFEGQILVPYPIESSLSGVMRRLDEHSRLWYRRTFELPVSWTKPRILLHFGAVDWETTVYVNGEQVGRHRGGYDPFHFDITDSLTPSGPQELVVAVWDPTEAGQARGKQVRNPRGIMYTPTSGIWQTVWLEPVAVAHIEALKITPDFDASAVKVETVTSKPSGKVTVKVTVIDGETVVASHQTKRATASAKVLLRVPDAKPWAPASPFLYGLQVDLIQQGEVTDSTTSYFGMRKIALGKDEQGITRIMLNNKFVFQVGFLDQGFWPDGLYTAPTDEALRYDIEMTKRLGMNMARKHVKVEPARWYYWCDKLGLLVWQDMPSGNITTDEEKQQFERELEQLVLAHLNHPSIIMWVVFNEGWGQYDTGRLTRWVKQLDPARLVSNASGWTDKKTGDIIDMHSYPGPGSPPPEEHRAAVLGEFGGLGLAIDGHTWTKESWGYQATASRDALTRRYVKLLRRVYELKEDPGLCAAVYTQTTDVETECNGLMTYDRAIVKPDLTVVADANQGRFPPAPQIETVLVSSEKEPATWQFTFHEPKEDWFQPEYDSSTWNQGPAGFGTPGTPGAVVRTEWKTSDIWLRREFVVEDVKTGELFVWMHHDENAEVWLNGVQATNVSGHTTSYEETELSPQAVKTLKVGRNVIAIHCHQTRGGQYIDAGLIRMTPAPSPPKH